MTQIKNKMWTAEAVYYYWTMDRVAFVGKVPRDLIKVHNARVNALMNRRPDLYCTARSPVYKNKFNPEWQLQHCKVLASVLNEYDVPIDLMLREAEGEECHAASKTA